MTDLKVLSRRWLEDGYGRGDIATMEELMQTALLEETLLSEMILALRTTFPDLGITIDEQIAEDSRVMTRYTFRGHQTGHLIGIPPTGNAIELPLVELHTWTDGQIAEWWSDFHPARMLQQLGLLVEKR